MSEATRSSKRGTWLVALMLAVGAVGNWPAESSAFINLELRPGSQTTVIGAPADVDLYAVSDGAGNQGLSALNVLLSWDPAYLELVDVDVTGSPLMSASGFSYPDPLFGINEALPPADGDGLFVGFAPFGGPVFATPAGTRLATFQFNALAPVPSTLIEILDSLQKPGFAATDTVVYDGSVPNLDVAGTLGTADVRIDVPEPGSIGVAALLALGVLRRKRRSR